MLRLQLQASRITNKTNQQFIYSVPVGQSKKGQTPIYRKPSHKDGLLKVDNIKNLAQFWDNSVAKFCQRSCIENWSYSDVNQKMKRVGSWIMSNKHTVCFLYAKNRPEWTLTDVASWNYGIINVPLYDTLGYDAFDHILKITQGTLLFTTSDLADNLWSYLSKNQHNLHQICFFDSLKQSDKQRFKKLNLQTINFNQLLQYGKILPRPLVNIQAPLTYCFTSGTTGIPKGVITTHRMAITQCLAMNNHYDYVQTDIHMSFLPIAHTFERFVTWCCIHKGSNIRYTKYLITEIFKDFAEIKPTTIPMVPRLLNKFYPVFKGIYEKQGNHKKMKAMFGGRLRMIVTGSAPVAATILKFFKQGLQCDVRQGYGQTETTAASFVTYKDDENFGIVGGPNSATQFKLVDVPEMNYLTSSNPPKGEVCVRGDSIFSNYFKDPKNTKQTVDQDGWNHSGDIGMIMPNGALKIIDRKKNIFKLQQGQYIAPQKIQNIYARCKYVAQSFLYGDSLKNYNVGIIHPNPDHLPIIAKNLNINEKDFNKLCQNKKIQEFIFNQITKQGKSDGLLGFQLAKKIRLTPNPFQSLNVVTSTMKLQRHIARQVFKKEIEEMYKND